MSHRISTIFMQVTEEAALGLTGEVMDVAEFLQRHGARDLVFRTSNLKLALTTAADGRKFWVVGQAQAYDWCSMGMSIATFEAFQHLHKLHRGLGNILVAKLSDIKRLDAFFKQPLQPKNFKNCHVDDAWWFQTCFFWLIMFAFYGQDDGSLWPQCGVLS